jgi:hypothetical protein
LVHNRIEAHRRASFWLQYAESMTSVQLALGNDALHSDESDIVALRQKLQGINTTLHSDDGYTCALIMTIGSLTAIEFSDEQFAFYGYDNRQPLAFDTSQPLTAALDATNSLQQYNALLCLRHQDGVDGYSQWEDWFAAKLSEHFALQAFTPSQPSDTNADYMPAAFDENGAPSTATPDAAPFSMTTLHLFALSNGLKVEDLRADNGSLWLRTDNSDAYVNQVLIVWGFHYKAGKGWWRQ